MKVETQEQRLNPQRKMRLRKKLKVAEFQEFYFEVNFQVASSELFNGNQENVEVLDNLIEKLHRKEGIYVDTISILQGEEQCELSLYLESLVDGRSRELTQSLQEKAKSIIDTWGKAANVNIAAVCDAWYPED